MRHKFIQKMMNSGIDLITGFNIQSELQKILEMESWTREQIENDQAEKFKRLSQYAVLSEYYKSFEGKSLVEFPVMGREEFKKNTDKLRTRFRKPYYINYTSGSTGVPVKLILSKEMLLAKRVAHQKLLKWNGLTREAREFKVGGVPVSRKSKVYYFFKSKRFVSSLGISEKSIDKLIKKFNHFKPEILYGYPSSLFNFIQLSINRKKILYSPKLIITHAENLLPGFVNMFKSVFPTVKIVNQYWTTEANLGVSCPEGNIHIDEDTVICELINKNSEGTGDLLITNLYSFDMPIIRYKVGDRVRFSESECSCGRKSKVIESIEGRENDVFELPDGRKLPFTVLLVSRYGENILFYQMVYSKNKALIEFRYMPANPEEDIRKAELAHYIKKDFGLDVLFKMVEKPELSNVGKFKTIIIKD